MKRERTEFTFSMMEYPFYHDGMTIDEWYEERDYYANHIEDVKKGKYKPLWKQKRVEDG